ncbi:MAG: uroporphyrinogen-III synthase [Chlamydiae bacterium]|nr:uroporphyrinogen-III synthase [Chlamydiota bacterium]
MRKVLYLGTDARVLQEGWVHYPVIRLLPLSEQEKDISSCLERLSLFSHYVFTSKNAVAFFITLCEKKGMTWQRFLFGRCLSLGSGTTRELESKGIAPLYEATSPRQEGMMELIEQLQGPLYLLYPRSSLARPLLADYLTYQNIPHEVIDLYHVVFQQLEPMPVLEEFEEIRFTSSSTVEGFFRIFSHIPEGVKISFQGPITEEYFLRKLRS